MIEVKGLMKRYEGGEALRGVDFQVEQGEIVAIAGLEGSGRTTLTDILSGCIEPDAGRVTICGVDLAEHASQAKQHMGYAPAKPALYRDMTPRGCMKFVADARGMSNREAGEKIDEAIRRFHLKDVADTPVRSLADAVCRMATLAQAAFTGAEVIIMDEPTRGMNPRDILEMRQAIRSLREDHAVLLTSRNLTELCAVADRVLVLSKGKIVAQGTPDELHRLALNEGTIRVTVRGTQEQAHETLGLAAVEAEEISAQGDEYTFRLTPKDGRDLREEVFRAVCARQLALLYMAPEEANMEQLLMEMDSERLTGAPEKEERGDEGDL